MFIKIDKHVKCFVLRSVAKIFLYLSSSNVPILTIIVRLIVVVKRL